MLPMLPALALGSLRLTTISFSTLVARTLFSGKGNTGVLVDTTFTPFFYSVNKKYVHTKTTIPTGQQISDTFGSSSFKGLECM